MRINIARRDTDSLLFHYYSSFIPQVGNIISVRWKDMSGVSSGRFVVTGVTHYVDVESELQESVKISVDLI